VQCSSLKSLEEGAEFGVVPVGVAYDLAADNTLAVNDVGLGPTFGVVELRSGLFGIADRNQVDVASGKKAPVICFIFVDADGKDGKIGTVVMELDQGRHLLDTGRAPGGPEVEQYNLAAVVSEVNGAGVV